MTESRTINIDKGLMCKIKIVLLSCLLLASFSCDSPVGEGVAPPSNDTYPGGAVVGGEMWNTNLGRAEIPESVLNIGRGRVTTDFASGMDEITAAAIQTDGKIVVCGVTTVGLSANFTFALARYNSNGTLDPSFGTGGKVTTRFFQPGGSDAQGCTSIVIQVDGKIVAAGGAASDQFTYNTWDFALARYNTDGSLDPAFGTGGLVVTNVTGGNQADGIMALALQTDGKIVAGGSTGSRSPEVLANFAIVRYNTNGSVDVSFGTGGKVVIDFNNDADLLFSLIIQPDNKIVAAGTAYTFHESYNFALARLDSVGNLDGTFGSGGKIVTDFSNSLPGDIGDDLITSMALQPDGKIVAVGLCEINRNGNPTTREDFAVARYNTNGTLDNTFGSGGKVFTDFNRNADMANSVALQPDGKIVVAGIAVGIMQNFFRGASLDVYEVPQDTPRSSDFAIARYNPDGSPDLSFATGGRGTTDFFGSADAATKVLVRPDGNILALGFSQTTPYVFAQAQDKHNTDFSSVLYLGTAQQWDKINDFDGDGRSDVAVWRETGGGIWYWLNSGGGSFNATQFGTVGDKIVSGDYDGDGKTDLAVWRQSTGVWYIQRSRDGFMSMQFGLQTDIPAPADFDGDGKTDVAVFRPSTGQWFIQKSRDGFAAAQFGQNGDKPAASDYDGDGRADIAVYRPSTGIWYLLQSTFGFKAVQFGVATDQVIPGDFDGDGKTDIAVYRDGPQAVWYLLQSTGSFTATQFGTTGDIPVSGDFDGDGKTDITVFRPSNGSWFSLNSFNGGFYTTQFGGAIDRPVGSNVP